MVRWKGTYQWWGISLWFDCIECDVLNEVRYGGVAERLEIREDTRGLGQREREKHARKLELWEVVVVLIVLSEGRESEGEKLCTNSSTPKPLNPEPLQFNGQC
jgi:hypothetical protein